MNKNKIIIFLLVQVAALYSSYEQKKSDANPKKRENLWLALRAESYLVKDSELNPQNAKNKSSYQDEELRFSPPSYDQAAALSSEQEKKTEYKKLVSAEQVDEDYIRPGTEAERHAIKFAELKHLSMSSVIHGIFFHTNKKK